MGSEARRMRRDLFGADSPPNGPAGWRMRAFRSEDAAVVHELLRLAYAEGGGEVAPYEQWWSDLRGDAEFSVDTFILALNNDGGIVGVAQCWTSGFIKDLVVHPDHRRRGVGQALLGAIFRLFADRGEARVDLKVRPDNHRAVTLYEKVGMYDVGGSV